MARYQNILQTIGNTPLVRINNIAPEHVNLYVKIESFNPMGSVKDRMALAVIESAESTGELKPGQTVIEATSGNTGIGLAMVCAQKGYPLVVTMAENFSIERRKLLRFLGAKVVLTPASEKGSGMLNKAVELAEKHGYYLCRQFENPANANVHTTTTAQEILGDFKDERLDYWVSGFGTGGTLLGVARALRKSSPDTKIIVAEPDNSPLLGSGIAQARDASAQPDGSHPAFRPHLMQGWSPDFISKLAEEAVDNNYIDQVVPVNGQHSLELCKQLASQEGIFVGISAGATLAGGLKIAEQAPAGANIVCMLPDTGERYLSTPLFDGICQDMNPEEIALSESTPCAQFVSSNTPEEVEEESASAGDTEVSFDEAIAEEVSKINSDNNVVIYSLEWCEFCWAARKLFSQLEIDYLSVDLDSVEYQKDERGSKIRTELLRRTGQPTIPQVFIGSEWIGGCSELFEAWESGELASNLKAKGIDYHKGSEINPGTLLPGWLQPRR